jgi:hypothetical protein
MSALCPHCGARLAAVADPFCPECRQPLDEPSASQAIVPADKLSKLPSYTQARTEGQAATALPAAQLHYLEDRIAQLERRLEKSSLYNENFLTRAFAVWGHNFVASLIILVPFYAILFCMLMIRR